VRDEWSESVKSGRT